MLPKIAEGATVPALIEAARRRAALGFVREGDILTVWKLDRLGRSLPDLIETVNALEARGVSFRSLTEAIDTTTPGGRLVFHIFGALERVCAAGGPFSPPFLARLGRAILLLTLVETALPAFYKAARAFRNRVATQHAFLGRI